MILRLAASFLFLLLARPLSTSALEVPKRPEGYVSDYAGMISPSTKAQLEENLRQFETETSNQVVVVTFPSLEGGALEDFSIRLAEAWKIGQKGKDNGVILLIFKNDRKVRIEVGYGLEGALTDATSRLIIANEIAPRFREGKFDEGIEAAVQAITAATKGEYRATSRSSSQSGNYFGPAMLTGIFLGALLPLFLLWILFGVSTLIVLWALIHGSFLILFYGLALGVMPLIFYRLSGRNFKGHSVLSGHGTYYRGGIFGGGGFGGGGFGGGGFGGGGGSFGGGGASGGW